jgi:signal transduction histidine kinase
MSDWDRPFLETPEKWARFVSGFTHELRTPIASFRMLADLLADAPKAHLGDQERHYCENMREVAQDIQSLVGDLAELTRLLAGKASVRYESVPLETLIDQVEAAVRSQAWERGIALTRSVDPALPKRFRTDPDRLQRLLVLVLGVAVCQARSEALFRLDIDRQNLRAVVSSDGPPLPEAAVEALFEPFSDKVRAARPRGGRSLALPLAHELARALGGTLHAENRGERPAFDLSIPAGAA